MRTLVILLVASVFLVDLVDPSSPFVEDPCKAQIYETLSTNLFNVTVKRPRPEKPVNLKPFIARFSMQYLSVDPCAPPPAGDFFTFISMFDQTPPARPFLNSPKRPPIFA